MQRQARPGKRPPPGTGPAGRLASWHGGTPCRWPPDHHPRARGPVRPLDDHRAVPGRDHPDVLRRRPVLHRRHQRRPRCGPVRPGPSPARRAPELARPTPSPTPSSGASSTPPESSPATSGTTPLMSWRGSMRRYGSAGCWRWATSSGRTCRQGPSGIFPGRGIFSRIPMSRSPSCWRPPGFAASSHYVKSPSASPHGRVALATS